jgi:hypothetical protein
LRAMIMFHDWVFDFWITRIIYQKWVFFKLRVSPFIPSLILIEVFNTCWHTSLYYILPTLWPLPLY